MAKLNIEITAPLAAFSNYADQLGYQAQIVDEGGAIVPNSTTKAVYLSERIKVIVAEALAEQSAKALKITKEQELTSEKQTLLSQILNAITISSS